MSPHTAHLISQDIRMLRGMMTAREKWAESLETSEATREMSRYIEFWRDFLAEIEERMVQSGNPRHWVEDRRNRIQSQPR